MTNIFSISLVTVQYFFPPRTYNFVFSTYCYILYLVLPLLVLLQYCTLFFTANVTPLLWLNDEFDGIWTSCDLRRRFRCGYGGFGFYNHSDIMTKMVWSQGGHIKWRQLCCKSQPSQCLYYVIPYFSDHKARRTIRRSINKRLLTRLFSYIRRLGL